MNFKNKIYLFGILFVLVLSSCSEEEPPKHPVSLTFGAVLSSDLSLDTRAELTINNITATDFPTPFYIEMETMGNTYFGRYEVENGKEAQLVSQSGYEPLNWLTPVDEHSFYSWTLPWGQDDYQPGSNPESRVSFDKNDPMYSALKPNVNKSTILETFIGAKTGPVNYQDNGEYVEMQYQHLVSKIRIGSLTLYKANGTMDKSVTGKITFYGMPSSATFNRRPAGNGAPVVMANSESEDPMEVTYDLGQYAVFYVCPGVDFSKLNFKVHLDDPSYNEEGDYYGDFSQIIFSREEYPGWDDKKSKTVLYAGEIMTLNMTLTQGHGVGVTITIVDWQVESTKQGTSYSHKGIYSDNEAKSISDAFYEGSTDKIKEVFDLYGEEREGEKIFPLYEDVDLEQSNFYVGKDYVLDGMGHTLRMKPNSDSHTVRIGPCRDIYITDGTFTVYIDAEGNIFKVSEDGNLEATGNRLGNLSGNKTTFQIDLETGKVS